MAKRKRKKQSLHLTDKRHPAIAIVSTGLGILSVGFFIVLCFISSQSNGKAGVYIGALGILCFLIALLGFGLSWISLHQDNIRPLFPTISAIINSLLIIGYLLLYIIGTFI